ncbi:MAG TPA: ROK family protein [Candidatus Paceibacterota bacterium]|nr:ROK family protein [Candidatus Paceibacterota bacterium]
MIFMIDIGGSNIRMGHSLDGEKIIGAEIGNTPQTYGDILSHLAKGADRVKHASATAVIKTVVVGIPGTRDTEGNVTSCPFISSLVGKNIKKDVSDIFLGAHVYVINDAYLVGLGEALHGAGIGSSAKTFAYMTISTGVGGAFISLDPSNIPQLIDGTTQFEPGRQILDHYSHQTLEELVSGSAVEKKVGAKPRSITNEDFWRHSAEITAVGIWNMVTEWSPDVFIIGGPMVVRKPGIDFDMIVSEVKKINTTNVRLPEFKLATLEDFGGLYGGLALAKLQDNA